MSLWLFQLIHKTTMAIHEYRWWSLPQSTQIKRVLKNLRIRRLFKKKICFSDLISCMRVNERLKQKGKCFTKYLLMCGQGLIQTAGTSNFLQPKITWVKVGVTRSSLVSRWDIPHPTLTSSSASSMWRSSWGTHMRDAMVIRSHIVLISFTSHNKSRFKCRLYKANYWLSGYEPTCQTQFHDVKLNNRISVATECSVTHNFNNYVPVSF